MQATLNHIVFVTTFHLKQPNSIHYIKKFITISPGNDLARVLRWGSGYTGTEDPLSLLRDIIDAEEIRLDRWTVVFHPEDKPDDTVVKTDNLMVKSQLPGMYI